jgi:hypothetical protein
MPAIAALVLILAAGPAFAQQSGDLLAGVRRLAESGARTLALQRLDAAQPKQADSPAWLEWERLRLDLLVARGMDRALLDRARTYAPGVVEKPGSALLLLQAARAALRLGEGSEARSWLAVAFGSAGADGFGADGMAYRAARQAVIDAYLAEGNADAAYHSMLRFQQEFAPLRAEEAERFVAGLVALERYGDAANWLARLDTRSSYAALLRLRAGLLPAPAAAEQARATLAKGMEPAALALLDAAGRLQNDPSLLIEAAELRLTLPATGDASGRAGAVAALWQLYGEVAQQTANQAHLLVGDDAAWFSQVARISAKQPRLGRALLGYLALRSGDAKLRADAQLQLILSLKEMKLTAVALALFSDQDRFAADRLDPGTRYQLGELFADAGRPDRVLAYWRNLAPPANSTSEQWQLRRLGVMIAAGASGEAMTVIHELVADDRAFPADARNRLLDIALHALGRFQIPPAEAILTGLRGRVQAAERFTVLLALARCLEAKGEPRLAAEAYLDAALAAPAPEAEREALRARESAAANLLKAGLREDARGIYDWLARNAKDGAVRESAARASRSLGFQ